MATPDAPTNMVEDNVNNIISFTLNPSYLASEHEYTTDGEQTFTTNTDNTIPIDNTTNYQPGDIGVRVKAIQGGSASEPSNDYQIKTLWTPLDLTVKPILLIDPSDLSSIDVPSGLVGQIDDLSPAGNNATQTNGANKFTSGSASLGGLNLISKTDANSFMELPTNMISGSQNRTFVGLVKTDVANQMLIEFGLRSSGKRWGVTSDVTTNALRLEVTGGAAVFTGSNIVGQGYLTVAVRLNGTTLADHDGYVNGTQFSTTGTTVLDTDGTQNARIGTASGSPNSVEEWGELVFADYAMTDDEIDRTIAWIHWRRGIESQLPLGHPYKDEPPKK